MFKDKTEFASFIEGTSDPHFMIYTNAGDYQVSVNKNVAEKFLEVLSDYTGETNGILKQTSHEQSVVNTSDIKMDDSNKNANLVAPHKVIRQRVENKLKQAEEEKVDFPNRKYLLEHVHGHLADAEYKRAESYIDELIEKQNILRDP